MSVLTRAGKFSAATFPLVGPLLLEARRFEDERGHFLETYGMHDFAALGIDTVFVQDNESRSRRTGTVRGLHHQAAPRSQAKLVRVLRGAILDVAVDLRRGSPGFARHIAVTMVAGDDRLLFIPAGFAHGFCTLEDDTEIAYKVSAPYDPALDRAIAWDDPALAISWPVTREAAILSPKDRAAPLLADAPDLPA